MKLQLIFTLVTTLLETLFYSGVIYGWSSMQEILVKERFFRFHEDDLANSSTLNNETAATESQLKSLSLVFTIASSVSPMTTFPVGVLLDMKGIWVARTVLLILIAAGYLLIVLAKTSSNSILLFIAIPLLDIGGYGLLSVNSQIGNLHPKYRSVIMSAMCGCFISSTVTFYIFWELYFNFEISFETIFIGAASMAVLFLIRTFLLMPRYIVPKLLPANYVYGYEELPCFRSPLLAEKTAETAQDAVENNTQCRGNCDGRSFKECLLDRGMIANVIHFALTQYGLMYFIGTIKSFVTQVIGEENPASIEDDITVYSMIQVTGFLVTPICGYVITVIQRKLATKNDVKHVSIKSAAYTTLITDFCLVVLFASSLLPVYGAQYITYVFVILSRSFLYGSLGPFIANNYPAKHFGKLYGVSYVFGGLILLLQYPTGLVANNWLDGSTIYYLFVILSLLATTYPIKLLYNFNRANDRHMH